MPPQSHRKFPTLGYLRGFGISIGILAALIFAGSAFGATFPDACGGANNFDYATCERVDYIAQHEDDNQQLYGWITGIALFGVTIPVWRGVFGHHD